MKKIGIIAAIIVAIILIVVGLVLLFKKYVRENILDGPGMVNETYGFKKIKNMNVEYGTLKSVRYSSSGDMNGNIDSTELKRQEDGSYIIETRFKQYYFEPMQCKEYSVSQESVNELESIIKEYNLIYWDKIDAEDGYYIKSITINGKKVEILENQKNLVIPNFTNMKEDKLINVEFDKISTDVKVPDTKRKASILFIFIGIITILFSGIILLKNGKIFTILNKK